MNKSVTSKEEILAKCRELVIKEGLSAVNMRSVAAACEVALGSLYNYFPSKAALVTATVESVWNDIFHLAAEPPRFTGFVDAVRWLHGSLQAGRQAYPGFITLHAMSFATADKALGKQTMDHYFSRIKALLSQALNQDKTVTAQGLSDELSAQRLVDLCFGAVLAIVLHGEGDIDCLAALVRRGFGINNQTCID